MHNYQVSIIVPGIRKENWNTVFEHCKFACKRYNYEIIFVSPYALPENLQKEKNVKYIKSFGSPAKCLHMGTLLAESEIFLWLSDDANLYTNSIDMAIDLLLSKNVSRDFVVVRYREGENFSGAEFGEEYYIAKTHTDLQHPGIPPETRVGCVLLLSLECYNYFGFDCRFEHMNFNVIDFTIRAQKSGESKLYFSPIPIMNCDFTPNRTDSDPVIAAYIHNDKPLFYDMYKDNSRTHRIEHNWKDQEIVWRRRNF